MDYGRGVRRQNQPAVRFAGEALDRTLDVVSVFDWNRHYFNRERWSSRFGRPQEVIESRRFWIGEKCSAREVRCNLLEHSQPFVGDTLFVLQKAGEVAAGSRQACNETRSNGVGDASENDGDRTGL